MWLVSTRFARPLSTDGVSDHSDGESWLRTRSDELAKAHVSLEHARAVMIRAYKASKSNNFYREGDHVQLFTRVVDVLSTSSS